MRYLVILSALLFMFLSQTFSQNGNDVFSRAGARPSLNGIKISPSLKSASQSKSNIVQIGDSPVIIESGKLSLNSSGENNDYTYINDRRNMQFFFSAEIGDKGILIQQNDKLLRLWSNPVVELIGSTGNIISNISYDNSQKAVITESKISYRYSNGIQEEFNLIPNGIKSNTVIQSLQSLQGIQEAEYVEWVQFIPLSSEQRIINSSGREMSTDFSGESFSISFGDKYLNFSPAFTYDNSVNLEEAKAIFQYLTENNGKNKPALEEKLNSVSVNKYLISFKENGIEVKVRLSANWLKDQNRQFPVTVDPVITIGSGAGSTTGSNLSPYSTYWHDGRHQYLIRASEITAAGGSAGNITSIAFNVSSRSTLAMNGFNIKLGHTALTDLTATFQAGLTTVYSGTYTVPGTGWQTITFSTPFNWNGTSNLIIEICFDNTSYDVTTGVYYNSPGFTPTAYEYNDNSTGCTMAASGTSVDRPNIRLDMSGSVPCPTVGFYRASDHLTLSSLSPFDCGDIFWITGFDSIDAGGYVKPGWSFEINPTDLFSPTDNSFEIFEDGTSIGGWAPSDPGWVFYGGQVPDDVIWTVYADGFDPTSVWSYEWCDIYLDGSFPYSVYDHTDMTTPVLTGTFVHPPECHTVTLGTLNGIAVFSGPGITDTGDGWAIFDAAAAGPGNHTIQYCWNNEHGCSSCATQNITVVGPSASAGSPATICSGQSTAIGGSPTGNGGTGAGTYVYAWSPTTGLSSSTVANPTASPLSTTTYTVTVTDDNGFGCTATSSVVITVNPLPTVYSVGGGGAYCSGGTGVTVTLSGSQLGVNYQLYIGGIASGSPVAGTGLALSWLNQVTAGTYTIVATNTTTLCTANMSGSVTVTINALPSAPTGVSASPTSICAGSSSTLSATVGTGGTAVYWYTGSCGGTLVGTGTSLVVSPAATTIYYARTYNSTTGCYSSSCVSVTVTVNALPNSPTGVSASPTTICAGASSTLSATVGTGGTAVYWYTGSCGGTLIGSGTSLVVTPAASTTYYARTYNSTTGCYSSACVSVTVTVNALPSVPTGVSASPNPICAGASSTLSGTVGGGGSTIHWYSGSCGGTYVGAGTSLSVTPAATTTYYARSYNSTTGCYSSACANVTVTVNALPSAPSVISAIPSTICNGSSSTLSASVGTGGTTINWYTGSCGGTLVGTGTSLVVSPSTTTTYYAITYNSTTGCYSSTCQSATVTVNALPNAPTGVSASPNPICAGASSTLSATTGSGGTTVHWYTGSCGGTYIGAGTSLSVTPASTTTYYARTYNSTSGCYSSTCTSVTVTVNALPAVPSAVTASPAAICAGSSSTLSATVGAGGTQVNWYTGSCGGTLLGTGNQVVSPAVTTTYYALSVNTTTGCVSSSCGSVSVTVNANPVAYNVTGGGSYCAGGTGVVVGLSGSQNGVTYALYLAGNPTGISVTGTGGIISFGNQTSAGVYTVIATNISGCSSNMTGSATVVINPTPVVYNVTGGGSYCAGASGVAVGLSDSDAGITYALYLGGVPTGTTVAGTGSAISFGNQTTAGTYTVVATSGASCTSNMSGSAIIVVNPLPTAFNVTGGGSYCSGGTGVAVGLNGSTNGVSYTLYYNGNPTATVVSGTGSAISFGSQTSAGTYTVVANNTTTGCTNTMTGNAVVGIYSLPNVNAGIDQSIPNGTSTSLDATVSGGGGGYLYSWTPAGSLINATIVDPTTTNLSSTTTFTLLVTDANGCQNSDQVIVTITGGVLAASASATPATICSGGSSQLNANASGGSGSYSYSWSPATGLSATNIVNPVATPASTTTYTVTVNDGFNTVTSSVTVNVNPLPTAYAVSGGGSYCAGGSGLTVILANSQIGVNYQLQLNGINQGGVVAGTSAGLSWTGQTSAGTYTVVATNATTGCTNNMTGSVTITVNPLPTVYNVTGGGAYCSGGTGVAVGLNGSSLGVNYTLYLGGVTTGNTVAGTGSSISFGNQTLAGTYTVVATIASTGCVNNMTGSVIVTINPLPIATATNTGPYCVGATIQLNAGGGTAYSWTGPASFSSTAQNPTRVGATTLMAGVYTVTVTSAAGCTDTETTTVVVNTLPTPTASNGGAYCVGQTIALSSSGGTGYSWSGPNSFTSAVQNPTISSATTAMAGSYTVTVTNASGCTATASTTVVVNTNPVPTASNTGPYCAGATISLGSSGGTGYSWSGPNSFTSALQNPTISSATTAMSGTYTVTVTNASGCTATNTTSVTVNPLPTAYAVSGGGAYCTGGSGMPVGLLNSQMNTTYELYLNGTPTGLTVSGTGGPVSFGNQSAAGTYTVVATNNTTTCSSTMSGSAIISINSLPVVNAGIDQTIPFGTNTNINATVSGGGGGYGYSWTPSASLLNAAIEDPTTINLTATTTFTLTVTDVNGCQNSDQITIFITGVALSASATSVPSAICLGESAQLNANASGGSGTYTYIWSPATGLSATNISNPVATPASTTTYSVTVNDGFNTATSSVTVTVYPLPTLYNVSGGGSYCAGGSGLNILLSNSQGGVNYQLQLNGVNVGPSQPGIFAGLVWSGQMAAGTYTVVATNTTTLCSVIMNGSAIISIDPLPTVFNVTGGGNYCSGGAGVAVGLNGSEIGITYQLILNSVNLGAPVSGSGSAIGFGNQTQAGTYTVLATNISTGCQNLMSDNAVVIINPLPTVFNLTGGGNYCSGGAGLNVGLSDSETGISYQLQLNGTDEGSPVAGDGNPIDFGVFTQAGTYTVVATNDITSCTENMSGSAIIVINPLPVVFDISGGGSYCAGGTGLNIILSGSQTGINYELFIDGVTTGINTPGTGNQLTWLNQTQPGVYTVIATNTTTSCLSAMNGSSIIVVNSLPVIDSISVVPLTSCAFDNAEITIHASGGTGPYTYSTDATNYFVDSVFVNLPAGNVNGFVLDANGCEISASTIIPNNTGFAIDTIIITDVLCNGDTTGQITVIAPGAISYSIDNWVSSQPSNIFINLPAGDYMVFAIDAGGCDDFGSAKIYEPDSLVATINISNISCNGLNNGNADIIVSGGTSPYSYEWDDTFVTDSSYISNLIPDVYYHVTVTDANGCIYLDSVLVTEPDVILTTVVSTDVLCYSGSDGTASLSLTGGTPGYSYLWSDPLATSNDTVSDLSADVWYYVTVVDANNCSAIDSVIVTQPDSLELVVTANDASCGGSDGSAYVVAAGGTTGYVYEWENSIGTIISNNDSVSNLASGDYTIIVTDANACQNSQTITINNTAGGNISVNSVTNVTCNGSADGEIIVTVSGGTPDFTFEWSTGDSLVTSSSSDTLSGLDGGIYSVTVTDINGCFSDTTITLTEPSAIQVDTIVVGTSCYNTNDGLINVIVTGGNSPYTYTWDPVGYTQNGNMYSDLPFGSYALTVTDAAGCSVSLPKIPVNRPSELDIVVNYENPGCYGDTTGNVSVIASGGTQPYSYIWNSTVMTSPVFVSDVTGLGAGTYFITVTDNNLCKTVDYVTLNEPSAMNLSIEDTVISYLGQITTTVTGGVPVYLYSWSNGATTSHIEGLNTGDYIITVTDANGCQLTDTVEIKIPLIIPTMYTPNGDGFNDNWDITNIGEYENLTIEIYNRWGDVVFSFSNKSGMEYMNAPWDGTYNGSELPMGSFVYIIDLLDGSEPYTGVVAIKR